MILDASESMQDSDLFPTRFLVALKVSFLVFLFMTNRFFLKLLNGFIDEFFDQNPISQLGIILTQNKRAEKITELTGTLPGDFSSKPL